MKKDRMATHQWDSSVDPEVVPLFLSLQWAQGQSLCHMRPILAEYGLSMAEFDVLATLRNAPEPHRMTPSQVQEEMVITSGGLTKIMLQLETRGLVGRLRQEGDMRVKPVCLTAAGKALIEAAMAQVVGASGAWVRRVLDRDEIATLTRLLGKLADSQDSPGDAPGRPSPG